MFGGLLLFMVFFSVSVWLIPVSPNKFVLNNMFCGGVKWFPKFGSTSVFVLLMILLSEIGSYNLVYVSYYSW